MDTLDKAKEAEDQHGSPDAVSDRDRDGVLRDIIRQAAHDGPRFRDFLTRLGHENVALDPKLSRNGRVTDLAYTYSGESFKAEALGAEFTWRGLQRKLGVNYVRNRDFRALTEQAPVAQSSLAGLGDDEGIRSSVGSQDRVSEEALAALETRLAERLERAVEGLRDDQQRRLAAVQADIGDALKLLRAAPAAGGGGRSDQTDAVIQRLEKTNNELVRQAEMLEKTAVNTAGEAARAEDNFRQALVRTEKTVRNIDHSATRLRQESLWLAFSAAMIASLVAALLTGLWISDDIERQASATREAVIEHLDKQVKEDPLREYFNRIMEKLDK